MIGIIVAMECELRKLLSVFKYESTYTKTGSAFLVGKFEDGTKAKICMSGIGKVNATLATQNLLEGGDVDVVVSTGVAGSLDPRIPRKDIVIATAVKYYDVWCGKPNSRGQVQGEPEWFPCIDVTLSASKSRELQRKYSDKKNFFQIHQGPFVSGDWFLETTADRLKALRACGRAKCADMESGAIAQVCNKYGVPFVAIRAISDVVGDGNSEDYEAFWKDSTERSFDVLVEIISTLR